MAKEAGETIFENKAIAVTKQALKTLHARLEKTAKTNLPLKLSTEEESEFGVGYFVDFVDGGSRTIPTLDDLLKYSNRGRRRITKLAIHTAPEYRGNYVSIKIGDSFPTAQVHISGDAPHAQEARTYCEDFLAAARSPFEWLYSISGAWMLAILWLTLTIVGFLVLFVPKAVTLNSVLPGFALMFVAMGLPWVIVPLRNRLFPKVVIAIGQEAARYETAKSVHTWAVRGVIGTALSVFAAVLWRWVQAW